VKNYSSLFISYWKYVSDKARHYLCGLMQAGKKDEAISGQLAGSSILQREYTKLKI